MKRTAILTGLLGNHMSINRNRMEALNTLSYSSAILALMIGTVFCISTEDNQSERALHRVSIDLDAMDRRQN